MFSVQRYVLVAMTMVAVATAAVVVLVFLLSWRARRAEQDTLFRLGGSRPAIAVLMLAEVGMVMLAAMVLATLLLILTNWFGSALLQAVVM